MKTQTRTRLASSGRLGLGILLVLLSLTARAQTGGGPITIQSLFLNQSANAHQGNYLEADAGLLYTDNVNLSSSKSGDTLALIGLVGNVERVNAPRLDYHLDSDIALVKYFNGAYDTQPFGYFDGFAEFKIFPGTLSWIGRDTYSQLLIDPFLPATPDNLESINYVTTGPQLTLKPTLRTTITADATYSNVETNSKSPQYVNINNYRLGGDLKIQRAFSNLLSAYVSGSYSDVRFSDTVDNTDFAYETGTAGINFGDARTVLSISGGYTVAQLKPTTNHTLPLPRLHLGYLPFMDLVVPPPADAQNPSGTNWSVAFSRLIRPTQRLAFSAIKQITDAANLFQLNLSQPVPGNNQTQLATGQPFTYRAYTATWTYDNGRTKVTVNGLDSTSRYALTPQQNQDSDQLNGLIARQLNPAFNLELGTLYERDKYYSVGSSQDTLNVITSLRWQRGPKIRLRFFYTYSDISPHGYTDNQIGVIASYALTRAAEATDTPLRPTSRAWQPLLQ
jgi:hypothetical protein